MRRAVLRGYVADLLLVMVALYLLTGFGISNPRLIMPLTFGLLGKALAQEIHALLWGPFIMLVLLHLYLAAPGDPRGPKKSVEPEKE